MKRNVNVNSLTRLQKQVLNAEQECHKFSKDRVFDRLYVKERSVEQRAVSAEISTISYKRIVRPRQYQFDCI